MSIATKIFRVALVTFMGATPALADTGDAWITNASPKPLVVLSDGTKYTKLDLEGYFEINGRLEFEVGLVGGVKSWSAYPKIAATYPKTLYLPGTSEMAESKHYSLGKRPDEIGKNLTFQVPAPYLKTVTTDMCRQLAADLKASGKSNKEIYGQNRNLKMAIWLEASVDSAGSGSNDQLWQYEPPYEVTVRCAKWSGPQVPQGGNGDIKLKSIVEAAQMKLDKVATQNGVCKIKTTAQFRSNVAGMTVKYRFVHLDGKKSKVFSVKTDQSRNAFVHHDWDIPNGPGTETGWVRIEGVGQDFRTQKAAYSMNCKDKAAGGLKVATAKVIKSTMKLTEYALQNGTCKVKLVTAISTDTANAPITYRYVHSSGKKSPVFSTKTAANKIAVVTKEWNIPNGAGEEIGWFKIVGVNTDFASNAAVYKMSCKGNKAGGKLKL